MVKPKDEYTYKDIEKVEVKGDMVVFTFKDGNVAEIPENKLVAINDFHKSMKEANFKSSDKVN
jgi:hypothetical protein